MHNKIVLELNINDIESIISLHTCGERHKDEYSSYENQGRFASLFYILLQETYPETSIDFDWVNDSFRVKTIELYNSTTNDFYSESYSHNKKKYIEYLYKLTLSQSHLWLKQETTYTETVIAIDKESVKSDVQIYTGNDEKSLRVLNCKNLKSLVNALVLDDRIWRILIMGSRVVNIELMNEKDLPDIYSEIKELVMR